jgi:hypothetical protein
MKMPASSTSLPNYPTRAKGSTSQSMYFKHCAAPKKNQGLGCFKITLFIEFWIFKHFRFRPPWAFMADLWRARARARYKTEPRD